MTAPTKIEAALAVITDAIRYETKGGADAAWVEEMRQARATLAQHIAAQDAEIARLTAAQTPPRSEGVVTEGQQYFVHDGNNCDVFATLEEARSVAEDALQYYKDEACDGWNDESLNIIYGLVLGGVEVTERRPATPDDGCCNGITKFENRELVAYNITAALAARGGEKGNG